MPQSLADVDLTLSLKDKDEYDERLKHAQLQLLLAQRTLRERARSAVILFEGWDAAGKGGTIKRLTERLDPRGFVVHPIGAPTEHELEEHYMQRFWRGLPRPGTFSVFDRSWYGRVLVERVQKLCKKSAWRRAYDEINDFERLLVADGVPVLKFFLHISKQEQRRRFEQRAANPFRVWKLTNEDWRNRRKWSEYEEATDEMLARTDSELAPWHLIAAEFKWCARVTALETCVSELARYFDWPTKLPKGKRRTKR